MGILISRLVFKPPVTSYTQSNPHPVIWKQSSTGKSIPIYFIQPIDQTKNSLDVSNNSPDPNNSTSPNNSVFILFSHGNASDIGYHYNELQLMSNALQTTIVTYDYIGYGMAKEENNATENGVYESAEAALEFMIVDCKIPMNRIVLFGFSLGSGATCHLIEKYENFLGVVLEGAFTGIIKTVANNFLLRRFDFFNNLAKIKNVKCPVFLIHGGRDLTIPFKHSVDLYNTMPKDQRYRPLWVKNAGHSNVCHEIGLKIYWSQLFDFIQHCSKCKLTKQ